MTQRDDRHSRGSYHDNGIRGQAARGSVALKEAPSYRRIEGVCANRRAVPEYSVVALPAVTFFVVIKRSSPRVVGVAAVNNNS